MRRPFLNRSLMTLRKCEYLEGGGRNIASQRLPTNYGVVNIKLPKGSTSDYLLEHPIFKHFIYNRALPNV